MFYGSGVNETVPLRAMSPVDGPKGYPRSQHCQISSLASLDLFLGFLLHFSMYSVRKSDKNKINTIPTAFKKLLQPKP